MDNRVVILMLEAMVMYFFVLGAHSLRRRFGSVNFYALIGSITAIMSWVTDAGLTVSVGDITFVVGSTVFYTALLLGVFVVYVFDGPRATRITIMTVAGVSIIMPLIAATLHFQASLIHQGPLTGVPVPSLRINTASVITTLLDLVFLAVAWEFLGKPGFRIRLWFRAFLTLLGVMWLDVLLFTTGAFAGAPNYLGIMQGTLVSRFIISIFALPFLYGYLHWQSSLEGITIENRPILAILGQVAEMENRLTVAEQEIRRRKRAETALRESEERYRRLVESSPDITYIYSALSGMVYCSSRVEKTLGHTTEDLIKQPFLWREAIHPDDLEIFDHALARDQTEAQGEIEYRIRDNTGNWHWFLDRCINPGEANGTAPTERIATDTTEQRMIAEMLQRQERLAALGQLAGGIAHDFNNILAVNVLYAQMSLGRHDLPVQVRNALTAILDQSRRAADLVNQILDFSRSSLMETRVLDLVDLVNDAVPLLRRTLPESIHLTTETPAHPCLINADATRIHQALMNLAINAADAMPDGGTLHIGMHAIHIAPDRAPPVSDMIPGEWICLSVSDTGTGMTDEVFAHLFEPFFTTKEVGKGTGLGLAQLYGIIKQHQGHVNVKTALGEGTTFTIYLPQQDGPAGATDPGTDASAGPNTIAKHLRKASILLTEDADELRVAVEMSLSSLGYRVFTAPDGEVALNLAQSIVPDLLITDIVMPRMGGQALLQRIREIHPNLKAIAITGHVLQTDTQALLGAGFAECVTKPFNIDELSTIISQVLSES